MRHRVQFAAAAIALFVPAAMAHDICVTCSGPDATYTCAIDDGASTPTPGARLACITALAREGKHESCRVKTSSRTATCDGAPRKVSLESAPAPVETVAAPKPELPPLEPKVAEPGTGPQTAPKPPMVSRGDRGANKSMPPPPPGAPRTVEELARQIGQSSGEKMQNAGTTLGDAARKTWGCISSMFKSCGP